MPIHPTFFDDVLGRVTWSAEDNCWKFNAGPITGEFVPASYFPEDSGLPTAEQGWERIRAFGLWLRANEPAVRAYVIDESNTEETDPIDPLRLTGILFYKNQDARLIYEGIFQPAACVQVNSEGRIIAAPVWFGYWTGFIWNPSRFWIT